MTTLGVNVSTQDPTYGWADIKPFGRMNPPKISAAESRARQLYQLYDRLVDQAIDSGASRMAESGLAGAIDDAWNEYKQADEYAKLLRRQYQADPNPERWF